ncbi:protein JASON-like [Phragmites australis]|uniref:protein JASON-like n=1 Tax=Phragmites australis TaxID=29695 RepID=UPI002D7863AE|nr:protein JASON-like [Phragmites australis]
MTGCLFGCFRMAGGGGGEVKGSGDGQLVSPSLAQTTNHKDGGGRRRMRPPSRNALSVVFLREDEGSRVEQFACSWTDQSDERKRVDQELKHEAVVQKSCGALLETAKQIQTVPEDANSVQQRATHSGWVPAISYNVDSMEALEVEDCETPSRSHQSSTVPDVMSSSWKGCDASNQHGSEAMTKIIDAEAVNNESVKNCGIKLTPAASHATNLNELTNENNTEACVENEYQLQNPAKEFEKCGVSREDFFQPNQSDEDPKCAKNDNLVSMEISISDECSLFQSSDGSVSSYNKIRDSTNTTSMEKALTTEATIHATRKKLLKNNDSDLELPSLSQWLKPPNPKKPFRDEALTGDRSQSAKSTDEDRPIIGMVAAHWKDKEPENFAPKWWDGNGIPNSTNKYKEDQKVSWHATPFEERLEKALSEEKFLSERNCSSGQTTQFLGVEGEESDTAESGQTDNRIYAAAYA